jgi:hypothetical protein
MYPSLQATLQLQKRKGKTEELLPQQQEACSRADTTKKACSRHNRSKRSKKASNRNQTSTED